MVEKSSLSLQYVLDFSGYFHFSQIFSCFSHSCPFLHSNPARSFSSFYLWVLLHVALAPAAVTVSACVANNPLWWIWSCSVIIYENSALSSLLRCFPCDFAWLNTAGNFGKAGRNRKDLQLRQLSSNGCILLFAEGLMHATDLSTASPWLLHLLWELSDATCRENMLSLHRRENCRRKLYEIISCPFCRQPVGQCIWYEWYFCAKS